MANTSVELVGLDFNNLKDNLKNYLRNNTQFKDVDFEASNMSVLIDLLAYNTYLNGFYTNMLGSEMWLDSAQLRDSVVSHAKELNYTPRSYNSSTASVTVAITPTSSVSSVVIPKYTTFTSKVDSDTYTFSTNEPFVITGANNGVFTTTLSIYEGAVTNESFTFDSSSTSKRYVLSNPTVDINSISVKILEDNNQNILSYARAVTMVGVTAASKVFFVQAAENGQYELVFGDNVFGRRPKDGAIIAVSYRASNGELPNGAASFVVDGAIDGHSNVSVTTVLTARGGAVAESLESIRFNAPRAYATSGRAVTASDYEIVLRNQFPEIQAISVYGGEEHDPPQFGTVFISTDLYDVDGTSTADQNRYIKYLKDRVALTVTPRFIQPEFIHIYVETDVTYDVTQTSKSTEDIRLSVLAAIDAFKQDKLDKFNTTLYYSDMVRAIDNSEASILGNDLSLIASKEWYPTLGQESSVTVRLGNALETETGLKLNRTEAHYAHTIYTSNFYSNGQLCKVVDDTLGNLLLAAVVSDGIDILKGGTPIGSVDYATGKVAINNLLVDSYEGSYVNIFMKTKSKNISAVKNNIITISLDDVTINVTGVNP